MKAGQKSGDAPATNGARNNDAGAIFATPGETRTAFFSSVSHELRTPLNCILGFVQVLRREATLSAEHAGHLELIQRSGEHLLHIINEVLDMSRLEAGKCTVELDDVPLAARVAEVVALLRPKAEEKGLNLECVCSFEGVLRTDGSMIRRILVNLLGNAIKFTSTGRVVVRAAVESSSAQDGSALVLEVEDSGVGISPEDLPRIFEPFFRTAAAAGEQGTGLGLAITRQYVEMLGGRIDMTSREGEGSRCRVELPVNVVALTGAREEPPSAARDLPVTAISEHRVLVVEDQPANARLLQHTLRRAGFAVRVAVNGQEGVEMFREWHPTFIWMDLMMPVLDGKEATRLIRAEPGGRDVKIVAISACRFESEKAAMLAAGCDEFVAKPCPPETILRCMTRHLGVELPSTAVRSPSASTSGSEDDIAKVPAPLREELREAVLSLDRTRVAGLIEQVRSAAPKVSDLLLRQATSLNFSAMLKTLGPSRDH